MGTPEPLTDEEAFAVMKAALEAGCNYWNGGEFYGTEARNSLTLLHGYYDKYPEDAGRVVLNVKGCTEFVTYGQDSSVAGVDRSIRNCLRLLGPRGRIDQFEPARRDKKVPIELTMAAFDQHIRAGRFDQAALSEVSAETIRRAASALEGPIGAVEVELSLWNTEPLTNGVAQVCAELNIPILAYCALTGTIKSLADLPEGDFRRMLPRFHPENLETNLKLADEIEKLASRKACTPGQIAINWLVALSRRPGMPRIIPIPGTASVERVKENAREVDLTDEEMEEIDGILAQFPVVGERYHKHGMAMVDV